MWDTVLTVGYWVVGGVFLVGVAISVGNWMEKAGMAILQIRDDVEAIRKRIAPDDPDDGD